MTNDLSNIFFNNFGTSEGRSAAGIFASSKAAILLSDFTPNAASDAARELNFSTLVNVWAYTEAYPDEIESGMKN